MEGLYDADGLDSEVRKLLAEKIDHTDHIILIDHIIPLLTLLTAFPKLPTLHKL